METSAVALVITAVFGGIASIIYSLKHIKKSECCGNKCIQETENIESITIENITQTSQKHFIKLYFVYK